MKSLVPYILEAASLAMVVSANSYSTRSSFDRTTIACQILQERFADIVSFPGSPQYALDIEHWANTSSQIATCSIEPESANDVSSILQIVGRDDIRSSFAVKGGAHAPNPGFSSTTGVQISMAKFSDLVYDASRNTVTVGTGLTWDQVYSQLEPLGVMVVGGRVNGVGVAGLTLGGGYSWKTDQYGLTIDTIVSYNLVLPSGQLVYVSNDSYPDLFFGLKGGLNNFGIVTNITLEAHPQTLVYGGAVAYSLNESDTVNAAISNFSVNNTDSKAQLAANYVSSAGQLSVLLVLFYDGPSPPSGIFDEFLSIPGLISDVKTQTFVDFMSAFPANGWFGIENLGQAAHTVPITFYPTSVLSEMVQQVVSFENELTAAYNGSLVVILVTAEPFTNPNAHSQGGAYPHPPSRQVTPTWVNVAYEFDGSLDASTQAAQYDLAVSSLKQITHNIQAKAVEEGVSRWDDILYPNYAFMDTPLELLYGPNVEVLRQIASKYDPKGIMNLTGGFRF